MTKYVELTASFVLALESTGDKIGQAEILRDTYKSMRPLIESSNVRLFSVKGIRTIKFFVKGVKIK